MLSRACDTPRAAFARIAAADGAAVFGSVAAGHIVTIDHWSNLRHAILRVDANESAPPPGRSARPQGRAPLHHPRRKVIPMKNLLAKISFAQWLGIVLAVLAIIFVFTNTETTKITLYGLHLSGPTWLILLIILAIGWLIGLLMGRSRYRVKGTAGK